jgi:hypothetical protein
LTPLTTRLIHLAKHTLTRAGCIHSYHIEPVGKGPYMARLVAGDNYIAKTPTLNIIAKCKGAATIYVVGNNKSSSSYER